MDRFNYVAVDCSKFSLAPFGWLSLPDQWEAFLVHLKTLAGDKTIAGIWMSVPSQAMDDVSSLANNVRKCGFKFHRHDSATDSMIFLQNFPGSQAPAAGNASIGAAAFVVDEKGHMIWVTSKGREGKKGLPGGIAHPNEGPISAVIREVAEEVNFNIPRESCFVAVSAAIKESFRYNQPDTYWVFQVLLPKGVLLPEEFKIEAAEIVAAGRMPLSQFLDFQAKEYGHIRQRLLDNIESFYQTGDTHNGGRVTMDPKNSSTFRVAFM